MESPTLRLGEAFLIAVEVHGNQRDQGGDPMMLHVVRVAESLRTDKERVVGVLHDTLEDCGSSSRANDLYARIQRAYGDEVADAVALLTRLYSEDYEDYIQRLSENPLAVRVKLADLTQNLREDRLSKLEPEVADRLRTKYLAARHFLLGRPEVQSVG